MNQERFDRYKLSAIHPKQKHIVEVDSHDLLVLLEGYMANAAEIGGNIKAALAMPEIIDKMSRISKLCKEQVELINICNQNIENIQVDIDFPEDEEENNNDLNLEDV